MLEGVHHRNKTFKKRFPACGRVREKQEVTLIQTTLKKISLATLTLTLTLT